MADLDAARARCAALDADVLKKTAELSASQAERERLEAELARARVDEARLAALEADLRKKNSELDAAMDLRQRLEEDLGLARAEAERLRARGWLGR
jgi:hypothetical protein